MPSISKLMILSGIVLILAGLIIWAIGNKFHWFGHLPGDIRITKENYSFYAPITSMLLLSALLSVVLWIIRKYFMG